MVNVRLCEAARLAYFFASPRHFDFLDCETEIFLFECETSRLLKCEPQIWLRAMRMSLCKSLTKYPFVANPCTKHQI